jgi:antitoxin VapB
MPMSIKNPEVERLAEELSRATHTSKTEVIRQALMEKKERMQVMGEGDRTERIRAYLETRVWPYLKKGASRRWTKAEKERFLGYGKHGV